MPDQPESKYPSGSAQSFANSSREIATRLTFLVQLGTDIYNKGEHIHIQKDLPDLLKECGALVEKLMKAHDNVKSKLRKSKQRH